MKHERDSGEHRDADLASLARLDAVRRPAADVGAIVDLDLREARALARTLHSTGERVEIDARKGATVGSRRMSVSRRRSDRRRSSGGLALWRILSHATSLIAPPRKRERFANCHSDTSIRL